MNKQDKTPRKIRTVKTILLVNSLVLLTVLVTSFFIENTVVSTLLKVFTILQMVIALVLFILQILDRRKHENEN